jgi:hypothetical protein
MEKIVAVVLQPQTLWYEVVRTLGEEDDPDSPGGLVPGHIDLALLTLAQRTMVPK